jgi:hypothetical protein
MPRFGLKSALLGVATVAVWLATLQGYTWGRDVRACILLTIAAASFVAAIHFKGRRKAFWVGFSISIILTQLPLPPHYELNYLWLTRLFERMDMSAHPTNFIYMSFLDTVHAFVTFGIAIVVGFIGTQIYDQSNAI